MKQTKEFISFDDAFKGVIGYEPIKRELRRIVDMMNNTEKYTALGVNIPTGILFCGLPGVGKTLLANCFIEASGWKSFVCRKDKSDGDFVDKIKSIYDKALENAPSIVLLDDMDKFANEDDERKDAEEYVTIQACIDATKNKGVFTIATVNNKDKLPESLIRVGRFDNAFAIRAPRGEEAEKIVTYYLSQKKCVGNVDAILISKILSGSSCAELESVINEAGIYAGFEGKKEIDMDDIVRATMRILFEAPECLDDVQKQHIREIAYHEAGHAVVSEVLEPGSVNIVSVKQYDSSIGGVTSSAKSRDYFYDIKYMQNRILLLLAGKAATELVYGVVDVGANGDLCRAHSIIDRFVTEYCIKGFDRFIAVPSNPLSSETRTKIERSVADEMNSYYQKTKKILIDNREFLDKLASALATKETLLANEIQEIKNSCTIVNP